MSIAGLTDRTTTTALLRGDAAIAPAAAEEDGSGFGAQFQAAIADLERTTTQADATAEGLVTGEVDIHEAMVSMEKADLVLRVAGTVRNKVIDAYQQLMQAAGS